jgi:ATP-dependent DNA helicase RecG
MSSRAAIDGPAASQWQTKTFAKLATKLSAVLGDKTAKQFAKLKIETVADLMQHVPRRYMSGTEMNDLSNLHPGEEIAVLAEVAGTRAHNLDGGRRGAKPRLEAWITDGSGYLELAFFGQSKLIRYWQSQLGQGERGIFAGKVSQFRGELQLAHPAFVMLDEYGKYAGGAKRDEVLAGVSQTSLIGLYPSSAQLRTWKIAECAGLALDYLDDFADPLPGDVRDRAEVTDLPTALTAIHRPDSRELAQRGIERLRFDEAFGIGLLMAHRRAETVQQGAVPRPPRSAGMLESFDNDLPFTLTDGQTQVADDIFADLSQPHPMHRLLQGEVGSGKTVVALRAMLAVIDAGGQAAFLAPTEVLASQHFHTITELLGQLGEGGTLGAPPEATRVELITGSMPAARRREALLAIASGEAGIVVGTHALLNETVRFAELGLVVVDEQHRFGVEQRAVLAQRSSSAQPPHLLVMTATPIPRTVALTVFGDLETSRLTQLPAGRPAVSTTVVDVRRQAAWVDRAWQRVVEEVAAGRQAYIVCARISESDGSDNPAAESAAWQPTLTESGPTRPPVTVAELYDQLADGPLANLRVQTLHGQLNSEEKEQRMRRFAAGEIDVLIATTVVEVGVDVPNATMMVICDADRFGMSQLHQLRGRIGRGRHPGVCLLLRSSAPDSAAADRLRAVAASQDGFELAETDLTQRREGDVLGAVQAGRRSSLRLLQVLHDAELITAARRIADDCVADDRQRTDPGLADTLTSAEQLAGDWLERA